MSIARVHGVVSIGVLGIPVLVEVDVANGLPSVGVIGLAGTSVAESRWRVRSAIANIGLTWPAARITVGLSPADLPKTGTGLDLAIAVGVLQATGQVPAIPSAAYLGELGLDGSLRPVPDALMAALAARTAGIGTLYVPGGCASQLAAVPDLAVHPVRDLGHLVAVLRGLDEPDRSTPSEGRALTDEIDLSDVRGHGIVRFGLEVAAAGGHHVSLIGPPGIGKSLLGMRLATLLPDLEPDAALQVTALLTAAGELPSDAVIARPITQAPHHAISAAAFLGTVQGQRVIPGVITRAHHGVLFMDEAPEFARPCLEGLRRPLESGAISIARVGAVRELPASFQLVLAGNPCPCGQHAERGADCSCSPGLRRRYAQRISGPILDRIDIRLRLTRPSLADLADGPGESSATVRARVAEARERSAQRFRDLPWCRNADIPGPALRTSWTPTSDAAELLTRALDRISMRGADRTLRLAWTLADLAAVERPTREHVASAMALRGSGAA